MNILAKIGEAIETVDEMETESRTIVGLFGQLQTSQSRRAATYGSTRRAIAQLKAAQTNTL